MKEGKRLLLKIQYDGRNYNGFAKQPGYPTIQGELEDKIKKCFGLEIKPYSASRTDSKVHALSQYVMFDFPLEIDTPKIGKALNNILPDDIFIKKIREVPKEFNCRHQVIEKTYRYVITQEYNPLRAHYAYFYEEEIDLELMRRGAKDILGTKDFTTFCSRNTDVINKVRTVYDLTIEKNGKEIIFEIKGNGFLYNMVRIIVGTLLEIGQKKMFPHEINDIIKKKDRTLAGPRVPSHGLYLMDIKYKGGI